MIRFLRKANRQQIKGVALVRLDFNTEDEWRMQSALSTLRFLLARSRSVVIISHRGRPEGVKIVSGKPRGFSKGLSLRQDGINLAKLLKHPVEFVPHFKFPLIKQKIKSGPHGSIFLLENMRFLPGEEKNSSTLAKQLAGLGDFYVNDAFAVSHRANASTEAIVKLLPAYAGLELENELKHLTHLLTRPRKPLLLILGGAKAADKLPVIRYFKHDASQFIVGGALGNTILKAHGLNVGNSIFDKSPDPVIQEIIDYSNIVLPIDYVVHEKALSDIGAKTRRLFASHIQKARTIIWNGPFGVIEDSRFRKGTLAVAKAVASNRRAFSVVGGGETVMFLKKYKLDKKISFVSTGGGAMLEFLAGKKLPGITALRRA